MVHNRFHYYNFHEGYRGCIQATSCMKVSIIRSVSNCLTMARTSFLGFRSNAKVFLSLDKAMGDQQCYYNCWVPDGDSMQCTSVPLLVLVLVFFSAQNSDSNLPMCQTLVLIYRRYHTNSQ